MGFFPRTTFIIPLHVSGIWIPHYVENHVEAGSTGVGLNLSVFLKAYFLGGECSITLNGEKVLGEQARKVCELSGVNVATYAQAPLPLGHGFGISAALLISHSLAAHIVLGKPLLRALQVAHALEVEYRTGLGDVIAEYLGGIVVRLKPGAPGVGVAYRVLPRERVDLVVINLGVPESTSTMLSRMTKEDYELGRALMKKIVESEDIRVLFECSRVFTSKLFNYQRAEATIKGLPGVIDYYMKKSALVLWVEREYLQEVLDNLRKRGIKAFDATISSIGVTLVYPPQSPQENKLTYTRETS